MPSSSRLVFVNSCNYKSICSRTSRNPLRHKDIENHKTQLNLLDMNLQSAVEKITKLQTLGAKQLEKTTYLENRSLRNNVRIEGIVEESGESWESTEVKVNSKEMFTEKLQMESLPATEHAHRTRKDKKPDGTPKPRTVVCKLYDWKKEKRSFKQLEESSLMESIFMKILLKKQWRSEKNFFQN